MRKEPTLPEDGSPAQQRNVTKGRTELGAVETKKFVNKNIYEIHHLVGPTDWPILLKHPKLGNILPWLQAFIFPLFV